MFQVFRVVQGRLRYVPRYLQGCFKGASELSKKSLRGILRQFQRRFKEVSRVFKESVKCVSRKFHKKFLISSPLPEQKEG